MPRPSQIIISCHALRTFACNMSARFCEGIVASEALSCMFAKHLEYEESVFVHICCWVFAVVFSKLHFFSSGISQSLH